MFMSFEKDIQTLLLLKEKTDGKNKINIFVKSIDSVLIHKSDGIRPDMTKE